MVLVLLSLVGWEVDVDVEVFEVVIILDVVDSDGVMFVIAVEVGGSTEVTESSSLAASASMALVMELSIEDELDFLVAFGEEFSVGLLEGRFVEVSSSMLRSIVVLTLAFSFSLYENEESISMKMETQAATVRDSKPFLKIFCLEGSSFLISKIASILVSLFRTLKKISACWIPESFRSISLI